MAEGKKRKLLTTTNFLLLIAIIFLVVNLVVWINRGIETISESGVVTKVIDGDTIVVEGSHIRLLGIDSDEKGYPCYDAAKTRLEELILNKEVGLEKDKADKDRYDRYLRYVFIDDENINLKLVQEGLAVARFYEENVKYKQEIVDAEAEARDAQIGCKWG